MDAADIRKELSLGKFRPIYCLFGPESFLVEELLRELVGALMEAGEEEHAVARFYADECGVADVVGEARTLPFLSRKRVVVVRRAEAWEGVFSARRRAQAQDEPEDGDAAEDGPRDGDAQDLLDYLDSPNPSSHLIFIASRLDGRMPAVKKLKSMKALVECSTLRDDEAARWVRRHAAQEGLTLSGAEAALLVEHVGPDLNRLAQEVGKLSEYLGREGGDVGGAVELLAAGGRERSGFELTDAIIRQQAETALRRLETLLTVGEGDGPVAPLRILGSLAWQFRRVWLVKDGAEKGLADLELFNRTTAKSPAKGLSRWHRRQLAELKDTAKRFSEEDLRRMLRRLLKADAELKGEGTSERRTLEALVIDLCGAGKGERVGP